MDVKISVLSNHYYYLTISSSISNAVEAAVDAICVALNMCMLKIIAVEGNI